VFTAGLIIAVFIGYFSWSVLASIGGDFVNKVLSYTDKIGAKIFTASVLNNANQFVDAPPMPGDILDEEEIIVEPEEIKDAPIVEKKSTQDLLDDIQEKLDIINQQVQELITPQNTDIQQENIKEEENNKEEFIDENNQEEETVKSVEENICPGGININTASNEDLDKIVGVGPATAQKIIGARPFYSLKDLLKVGGIGEKTLQEIINQSCAYIESGLYPPLAPSASSGGGGGANSGASCKSVNNIFITEFQVEGETIDDDWVELYNPNNNTACLGGWSIQKASSTGNISKIKNFGKDAVISAKGYFLITNNSANQELLNLADMTASGLQLSSDPKSGNTIYLVGKKDEIANGEDPDIIDKVGFGLAKDYKVLPALMPNKKNRSTGRIWDEIAQEYKNTGNNSADFEIDTPTPKAQNEKYIEPEPTDTTPPEVVFNLDAIQNSPLFDVGFTIIDPFITVTPSGIASYIFRWEESEEAEWYQDGSILNTVSSSDMSVFRSFTGEYGKTYNFQVQANDLAGNISDWLPDIPATTSVVSPASQQIILINEIQILPVEQRFVELYNPGDSDIDLTGWYLQRKMQDTKASDSWGSFVSSTNFDNKTILANGYFLISRKIIGSDILSDITISTKEDNALALKNSKGIIIDKVGWGLVQDFEVNPALVPLSGQSITRTSWIDTDDNSVDFIISDTPTPKLGS